MKKILLHTKAKDMKYSALCLRRFVMVIGLSGVQFRAQSGE